MSVPNRAGYSLGILSRRALEELGALQNAVLTLGNERGKALRLLLASRYAATALAQREFWLEFAWADQEYRTAVRRLADFCLLYPEGSRRLCRGG